MSTVVNAVGRRKASIARIYLQQGNGAIVVNGKDYKEYFSVPHLLQKITEPFDTIEEPGKFDVKVVVSGGGVKGQAEAVRLGISRALLKIDEEYRQKLKPAKLLVRDARVVERKKPGLRKARKRDQFSKR